jgi:hypothetical protein
MSLCVENFFISFVVGRKEMDRFGYSFTFSPRFLGEFSLKGNLWSSPYLHKNT